MCGRAGGVCERYAELVGGRQRIIQLFPLSTKDKQDWARNQANVLANILAAVRSIASRSLRQRPAWASRIIPGARNAPKTGPADNAEMANHTDGPVTEHAPAGAPHQSERSDALYTFAGFSVNEVSFRLFESETK